MTLSQGDIIEATFSPVRENTLRPDAVLLVGQRLRFIVAWRIEPEDGGRYVGQWACTPRNRQMGWAPEEDLSDIEIVGCADV